MTVTLIMECHGGNPGSAHMPAIVSAPEIVLKPSTERGWYRLVFREGGLLPIPSLRASERGLKRGFAECGERKVLCCLKYNH
jgi:hypothetical protein